MQFQIGRGKRREFKSAIRVTNTINLTIRARPLNISVLTECLSIIIKFTFKLLLHVIKK